MSDLTDKGDVRIVIRGFWGVWALCFKDVLPCTYDLKRFPNFSFHL